MSESEKAQAIANLRLAFDLHDAGVALMRQNLLRRYPGEPPCKIDERLLAWLRERPGAEPGDADCRRVALREIK